MEVCFMNIKDKRSTRLLFIVIATLLMTMTLLESVSANNEHGWGPGKGGASGTAAAWPWATGKEWTGSGTTEAWDDFAAVTRSHRRDPDHLVSRTKGLGFKNPDGSYESLLTSCKRSRHIWWYGRTTDGYFNTTAGINTQYPPVGMNYDMKAKWDTFTSLPSSQTNWGRDPGPIIVCSGVFDGGEPAKKDASLTAGSGTYVYNGNTQVVTHIASASGLLPGHSYHASSAYGARMYPGTAPVAVNFVKITEGSKDVTQSDYNKITTHNGLLTITPDKSPVQDCVYTGSSSVTAVTLNKVNMKAGFTPSTSPGISPMTSSRNTPADGLLNSRPNAGDLRSSFPSWSSQFKAGEDFITKSLYLGSNNVHEILGEHGGVLDILRTHEKTTVDADFCQPMKGETWVGEDGEQVTVWVKDGPEIIQSIGNKSGGDEKYSYQILGVNCNIEGFKQVLNSGIVEVNYALGEGTASGLLETKESPGISFPLGRSGITGDDKFYTDGPSCIDTFKEACVSDKLSSTAMNDADNNVQINPLYTEEDEGKYKNEDPVGHGKPNEDKELVFFRDNVERQVRADVWYPNVTHVVDFETFHNRPATKTTARLFGGTPDINITTIKGLGTNGTLINQLNKDFVMNKSHENKFTMKSQWASDNGKPYELGIDWVYDVDVTQNTATVIDGYNILETGTKTYTFDAHCQFKDEKGKYQAQMSRDPFVYPKLKAADFKWFDDHAVRALFTRSVSDKSQ